MDLLSRLGVLCSANLIFLGGAVAQQIWRVHHVPGPGVDFTDLPQAVAAAAPGDEIWVYYFNGQSTAYFTAPFVDKPISIVGFQVGAPPGTQSPTSAVVRGVIIIAAIPAGQNVTLNGIQLVQQADMPAGIVAVDCAGDILLEDIYMRGNQYDSFGLHFERCQNVVIRGGDITMAGRPLTAVDSRLLLSTTVVDYSGPAGFWPLLSYPMTTETVRLVRSHFTMVGSIVRGIGFGTGLAYVARNPVVLEDSVMRVGPGSLLWSSSQIAYYELGTNTIRVDPRATLQTAPVPGPPSEYIHSVYHDYVVVGEPYSVVGSGPPGGFAVLMAGDYASPSIPTSFGPLAIDPASIVFGGVVPLSTTTGFHQWFEQCPTTALIAHAYAFQAIMLAPDGTLQLSEPSPFTAGWQHGRIP